MSVQTDASLIPQQRKSDAYLSPNYEIKHEEKITVARREEDIAQFVERHDLAISTFEYARSGIDPGLVIIFNQESFKDKNYRQGSSRDVNEIITCMSRLGFNINEGHIYTDLSRDEILKTTQKLANQDLSQVNSLIVFFLTHGEEFNRLHAKDVSLSTEELWKDFAACKDLLDTPKMFIFQACKGNDYSTVSSQETKKITLVPDTTFRSNYIGPDMLIVYSTTEGNVSFRDPKTGTWFIQELCKNFSAYGRRDDVVSLIIRTTKCLGRNYYHNEQDTVKKQMPVFVSTLKRKFYLNRSKERNILIKLIQEQEAMKKSIQELEEKVDELLQEKRKQMK